MRIEAGKHPAARYATVYLDGRPIDSGACKWADAEAGEVACYRRDAAGEWVVENDEFVLDTLRGVVRIDLPPEYEHLRSWE